MEKGYKKFNIFEQGPTTNHDKTVQLFRLIQNGESNVKVATLNKAWLEEGQQLDPHTHPDSIEYYLFLSGLGQIMVEGEWFGVKPGDFITIAIDTLHSLKNDHKEPLDFITLRGLIDN